MLLASGPGSAGAWIRQCRFGVGRDRVFRGGTRMGTVQGKDTVTKEAGKQVRGPVQPLKEAVALPCHGICQVGSGTGWGKGQEC